MWGGLSNTNVFKIEINHMKTEGKWKKCSTKPDLCKMSPGKSPHFSRA